MKGPSGGELDLPGGRVLPKGPIAHKRRELGKETHFRVRSQGEGRGQSKKLETMTSSRKKCVPMGLVKFTTRITGHRGGEGDILQEWKAFLR